MLGKSGAVGACLSLVVAAELFFAWRGFDAAKDTSVATVSYSKEPMTCSEPSPWLVCTP